MSLLKLSHTQFMQPLCVRKTEDEMDDKWKTFFNSFVYCCIYFVRAQFFQYLPVAYEDTIW